MRIKLAILAIILAAASLPPARAETLKVAVGNKGFWNTDFYEFAQQQGFFKAEGLDVDITYTDGGAATLQPAITGNIDLALGNGFLGVIAAYVKGAPIRVVSAEATGTPELFWYATAASGIKSLKDATNRTIGFSSPGSSGNLVILGLLAQDKVEAKPVATGNIAGTMTQVMTGQIDIGWSVAPFALPEVDAGKLVIVARGDDLVSMRHETVRVQVANLQVLQTRRDAILRFLRADDRAINWAYSHPQAIDYFAKGMHVSRAVAERAVKDFWPKRVYRLGEVQGVQNVLNEALATKRIPAPMTPDQVAGLFDIVYRAGQK